MSVRQIAYRLKADGKAEVIRDAREVGSALRESYAQGEAGANAASAAAERQEQRYKRLAAAARDAAQAEATQARYNAALGVSSGSAGSARESAAVFAMQAEAMEDGERRARALRAVIDPLGAAQDRLNDEMREYDRLAKAGQISTVELAQAQRLARQRFDEQSVAIERNSRGLSRLQVASRLNLTRQAADVMVTGAMGMNPAMIAMQQGPQILDALATSGIKANAAMLLLGGGLGVAAAAAVGGAAAWYDAEQQALKLERVVTGLGRTSGLNAIEVEAMAEANAEAAGVSIRSAREIAATYLSTGRIGGEVLGGLIELTKDYASFTGQDVPAATQALASAMAAPDKAARDMSASFGLMDQATLASIDSLMKQGDVLAAQKILIEELDGAVSGHAQRIGELESFWDVASMSVSNYIDWVGKALQTTRSERIAQLQGQLRDGSVGTAGGRGDGPDRRDRQRRELTQLQFEAGYERAADENAARAAAINQTAELDRRRREAQSRTRRRGGGRDAAREAEREAREALQRERREEDIRTQMDLEVARARSDYATIGALEEQLELRQRVRQLIDDGAKAEDAQKQALAEQLPLLDARRDQQTETLRDMHREIDFQIMRELGETRFLDSAQRRADVEERILAVYKQTQNLATAQTIVAKEQLELAEARATALERVRASAEAEHRLNLARLAGREAEYERLDRQSRVEARAREIEQREGLNRGEGAGRAAQEIGAEVAAEAEGVRRAWIRGFVDDIRQSGLSNAIAEQMERASDRMLDRLIDRLMEIDWSKAFQSGESGGGFWSQLFSVGKSLFSGGSAPGSNAAGTEFWRGGLTWVGEAGKELIDLPRGSRVLDHQKSLRLASQGTASAPPTINMPVTINAPGADQAALLRVEAAVDRLAKSVPGMAIEAFAEYRDRAHGRL